MFTIGIFTTHLPYIVLVVFYAFFWVIGYDNAVSVTARSENLQISATQLTTGVSELNLYNISDTKFTSKARNIYPGTSLVFSPIEKLIHKGFYFIKHIRFNYSSNLFSRPPPRIF